MIYAVIDTNVFVSALWTKNDHAPTFLLLKALQEGRFTPLYNEQILAVEQGGGGEEPLRVGEFLFVH